MYVGCVSFIGNLLSIIFAMSMRRKFGDWEASFDEKLVYPSLALLETASSSLPRERLDFNTSPSKWRLNRKVPVSMEDMQELAMSDNKAERILREKIREEYLKRLQKQNRSLLKRLSFHSAIEAAVAQNRLPKAVKRITDSSSDVDIVSYIKLSTSNSNKITV